MGSRVALAGCFVIVTEYSAAAAINTIMTIKNRTTRKGEIVNRGVGGGSQLGVGEGESRMMVKRTEREKKAKRKEGKEKRAFVSKRKEPSFLSFQK